MDSTTRFFLKHNSHFEDDPYIQERILLGIRVMERLEKASPLAYKNIILDEIENFKNIIRYL